MLLPLSLRIRRVLWRLHSLPERTAKTTRGVFYALGGMLFGFAVLHPFSMIVFSHAQEGGGGALGRAVAASFGLSMWPMWVWYGGLGAIMGWGVALLVNHMRILDGIIPICAWCGRIRVENPEEPQGIEWKRLDLHLQEKGLKETGSICPDCMPRFLTQLKKKSEAATYWTPPTP